MRRTNKRDRIGLWLRVGLAALVVALSSCGSHDDLGTVRTTDAVTKLKKLQAATQVGVNRLNYDPLLIEAQASVNEANRLLGESPLKQALNNALEDYVTASAVWDFNGLRESNKEPWLSVKVKYNIPEETTATGTVYITEHQALNQIWASASTHVKEAGRLAGL